MPTQNEEGRAFDSRLRHTEDGELKTVPDAFSLGERKIHMNPGAILYFSMVDPF